jgi:hypothetical protein
MANDIDIGLLFNSLVGDWIEEAPAREDRVKVTAPIAGLLHRHSRYAALRGFAKQAAMISAD